MNFDAVNKSFEIGHGHGHVSAFPTRDDYMVFLRDKGITANQFADDSDLVQEVYLDWLRRGQVGCVFGQLFGRPAGRQSARTSVFSQSVNDASTARALASEVDAVFRNAVAADDIEALTVLLPRIIQPEALVLLIKSLSELPQWRRESVHPWRDTLVVVGLRARIKRDTWAEILGMGPFPTFLPPTRQCPVTSLEIRTKVDRSIWSKIHPGKLRASHLAQIPAQDFIGQRDFGKLFKQHTPALRLRILGGNEDQRAKAHVTFALPRAIWEQIALNSTEQPAIVD